jgi:hypothetical protein
MCIFCRDGRADSGKHILPDWLNRVFSQFDWRSIGDPPRWGPGVQDFQTHPATEDDSTSIAIGLKETCKGQVGYGERFESVRHALKLLCDLGAHTEVAETGPR